jgi:hypothetical protein
MFDNPNTSRCDDCGLTFPGRQGEGECLKCARLAEHSRDSREYADIVVWLNLL